MSIAPCTNIRKMKIWYGWRRRKIQWTLLTSVLLCRNRPALASVQLSPLKPYLFDICHSVQENFGLENFQTIQHLAQLIFIIWKFIMAIYCENFRRRLLELTEKNQTYTGFCARHVFAAGIWADKQENHRKILEMFGSWFRRRESWSMKSYKKTSRSTSPFKGESSFNQKSTSCTKTWILEKGF